jgi:Arm DNA-binding domain
MKKPPPMLTPRIIADLRSGDECADPDYPGLRVRRTNAARVFFYRYRASDGALREIKLGEFGPMTLTEARKALGRLKLERERGFDPQLEKQQARAEARRLREAAKLARYTVEKMVEDYIAERLSKQRRGDDGARLLRRVLLSRLGERAAAVTRRELQDEVVRPMLNRAPRCGTCQWIGKCHPIYDRHRYDAEAPVWLQK